MGFSIYWNDLKYLKFHFKKDEKVIVKHQTSQVLFVEKQQIKPDYFTVGILIC